MPETEAQGVAAWLTDDHAVECCGSEGCEQELGYYNPRFSSPPIMVCPDCAALIRDAAERAEVLELDRQNVLRMADGAGRNSARLGTPRHMNPYPDNGLHVEQREAWFRAHDEETK